MAEFLTELDARLKDDDAIWVLDASLSYQSDIVGKIEVPPGFETDFASVPRLPVFYTLFGNRAHREAVLHDYLYRKDAKTDQKAFISRSEADKIFLEAMAVREKPFYVRWPMYLGVRLGGWTAYHKKYVKDKL